MVLFSSSRAQNFYFFKFITSGGSPFGQQRPNFMLYLLVYNVLKLLFIFSGGSGLISCYFLVVFKLHTSLYDYFFRLLCYVILNSVYYYRSTYLYSLLSPADHPTSLKSMISSPISIQYCFIGQEFHRMAKLHLVTVYAASCLYHT